MTQPSTGTPAPTPAPKPKSSMGKIIKRIVLALVLLFVITLVSLYFMRNTFVRMGVERGGQFATEQNTALDDADLSLFGGAAEIGGLNIANLNGYSAKSILTMKKCEVSGVDTGSIFSNTVVIDQININDLEITIDQPDITRNNLNELIKRIQAKTAAAGSTANASPGKQLKINKLSLTGTIVHLDALGMKQDFNFPLIEIKDPTNPDGRPTKIADLLGKILLQISKQLLDNPNFPSQIKDAMKDASQIVDKVRGDLDKNVHVAVGNITNQINGATSQINKVIPGATSQIDKAINDAGKNLTDPLKNLIPGSKTKP